MIDMDEKRRIEVRVSYRCAESVKESQVMDLAKAKLKDAGVPVRPVPRLRIERGRLEWWRDDLSDCFVFVWTDGL